MDKTLAVCEKLRFETAWGCEETILLNVQYLCSINIRMNEIYISWPYYCFIETNISFLKLIPDS